jgi:hypothetical protein
MRSAYNVLTCLVAFSNDTSNNKSLLSTRDSSLREWFCRSAYNVLTCTCLVAFNNDTRTSNNKSVLSTRSSSLGEWSWGLRTMYLHVLLPCIMIRQTVNPCCRRGVHRWTVSQTAVGPLPLLPWNITEKPSDKINRDQLTHYIIHFIEILEKRYSHVHFLKFENVSHWKLLKLQSMAWNMPIKI